MSYWIESHQSLPTHRKLLRAASLLRVDKYKLIGHLHCLWYWGLDNAANDGNLGDVSDVEIADAAGWPMSKAEAFVKALAESRFLDKTDEGYGLHNWYTYAGKLNEKRAKDRARKSPHLHKENEGKSSAVPVESREKSQAPHQHQPDPFGILNQPDQPTTPTTAGARPNIFAYHEAVFGPGMTDTIRSELLELEQEHSDDCLRKAFHDAGLVVPRPRSLKYVTTKLNHTREECGEHISQTRHDAGRGAGGGRWDNERHLAEVARIKAGGDA